MSASFRWDGLTQLRLALLRLPRELTKEAAQVIHPAAKALQDDIRAQYPVHTGNLRSHVVVRPAKVSREGVVAWEIASTARHAFIFERGTKPRQARFRLGRYLKKPANRGFMPAADIFVKTAIRHRARVEDKLVAIVEAAGFEVRRA